MMIDIKVSMLTHHEHLLTERLKNGDEQAYREVIRLFRDRIFNTALGIVQHVEDAEDLAQEVFMEIFRSVRGFRGQSALSTWIYRITVQKSLEHLRRVRRKKRHAIVMSLLGREHNVDAAGNAPFYHPGIRLENRERSTLLFGAIAKLPEDQKTAFVLQKVEGLTQAEVADVMEKSVAAVESLVFRAKQNLRKLLADYYEENYR